MVRAIPNTVIINRIGRIKTGYEEQLVGRANGKLRKLSVLLQVR
jgi:hypothetical protein